VNVVRQAKQGSRTGVGVVELEKVALMVQLVRVAVQKGKDTLQLRQCVLTNLHYGRLVRLYHGHGTRRSRRVATLVVYVVVGG
jgi:hypothetical protein